ncbi:hypothetical protein VFPPC_03531 [Pochonia chlamydosporia 170]|uniref:Uncharacterized protein n=1 Tax=Pochonia chlamydosporia 170 TaxID=1380566 RepID=A0A179G143_METCM|nr:hypothetical protein VFPPC_03531 [Pochonia chlamydosporia 170]OAQ71190.1 hypothetical protein VFPPC_03531 [Pochonia chlamydosporia 170]
MPAPRNLAKRKRVDSGSYDKRHGGSRPPHLPTTTINPFSRSPGEIRQFSLAGLKDTDEDPTREVEHFPHRGIKYEAFELGTSEGEEYVAGTVESHPAELKQMAKDHGKRTTQRRERPELPRNRLDVLLRSIHRFLDRGEITKSARLFSIILQLRPDSRPLDIRQHNLWAIGAEIIMRQGEDVALFRQGPESRNTENSDATPGLASGPASYRHIRIPRRWGSPANVNKLKAYLETLIKKHPYDHKFPRNTSALDFQLTLFSCELYSCHAMYSSACSSICNESFEWTEVSSQEGGQYSGGEYEDRLGAGVGLEQPFSHTRPQKQRKRGRLHAYDTMKDVAKRMDSLINELPYSKNVLFLRLRATVSLFIADLLTPEIGNANEIFAAKELEKEIASSMLQRVMDSGGQTAIPLMDIIGQCGGLDLESQRRRFYASLPIRGS